MDKLAALESSLVKYGTGSCSAQDSGKKWQVERNATHETVSYLNKGEMKVPKEFSETVMRMLNPYFKITYTEGKR